MNRRHHALLAPLLAVLALLLGLAGSAAAAFNHAATEPLYGNFLLHTEAPARIPLAIADPARENGVWLYDSTLGVPVYVNQNPWTKFDPEGLTAREGVKIYGESWISGPLKLVGAALDGVGNATDWAIGKLTNRTARDVRNDNDKAFDKLARKFTPRINGQSDADYEKSVVQTGNLIKTPPMLGIVGELGVVGKAAAVEGVAANSANGPVKPGDTGTYGGLKRQKNALGETEPMDMDHRPSFAAQVKAREAVLGRQLEPEELAKLKASTPAVATPRSDHQQKSRTYGGRNTKAQIAKDAADLDKAAAKDNSAYK